MIDHLSLQEALRTRAKTLTVAECDAVELLGNNGFGDGSLWSLGTGWTIAAGVATKVAGVSGAVGQGPVASVDGTTYRVVFTITRYVAGTVTPAIGGTSGTPRSSAGTFTEDIVAPATVGPSILLTADTAFDGDIDNVYAYTERIGASGSVFTRTIGSFLTDGFSVGMEVAGSGSTVNTGPYVVTKVTALTLTVSATLTTETAAGADRNLTVGLPANRAWENIAFEPVTGAPWIEEQMAPGTSRQITIGEGGQIETRLLYSLMVHAPENKGVEAPNRYADALLELFAPRTAITFGPEVARVRTDTGPYRGQLLRRRPGFATVPVTFPLEIRSNNTI